MNKINITVLAVSFWVWTVIPAVAHAADCKTTNITPTAPDSRYADNGNGTVTDLTTGLMWKQCTEGQSSTTTPCDTGTTTIYTWQEALQQAETINVGGGFATYTDWRVPNRNELMSLVEYQCHSPSINRNFFPNTWTGSYSTSSPYVNNPNGAWKVEFSVGAVTTDWKNTTYRARLVRGGL